MIAGDDLRYVVGSQSERISLLPFRDELIQDVAAE